MHHAPLLLALCAACSASAPDTTPPIPSLDPGEAVTPVRLTQVTRAAWDETPHGGWGFTRYYGDLRVELDWIVVHHTSYEDPPGIAEIERYHREERRFGDIGYHFLIAEDGTVYEGRAIRAMGAHAGTSQEANRAVQRARRGEGGTVDEARRLDPDHGAIGIAVDGNFMGHPPPAPQRAALELLITHLRETYDIDEDHVITHREVADRILEPRGLHNASPETVCPGDALQHVFRGVVDVDRPDPFG